MICCKNCGVELEPAANYCPLCGEPVAADESMQGEYRKTLRYKQAESPISEYEKLTQAQKRKIFWELSGIVLVSGILVSLIINLVLSKDITWSRYTIVTGIFLFSNITFIAFWQKRIFLLFTCSFVSTSILLMVMELFSKTIGWSITYGIPLVFAAYATALTFIMLIRISSQHGLNIVTYALVSIGLLMICTEGIISLNVHNVLSLNWSLIVFACIIPVSAISLFIHYRLKKVTDLKKFFHI